MHESEIPSLYCFLPSSPSSLSSPYSVRPENLQNLHTTDGKNYSWNYPDSWEKPCSFFSLHFQVKVVHNEDTCHSDKHIRVIRTSASSYTSLQCKKKACLSSTCLLFCCTAPRNWRPEVWDRLQNQEVYHLRASSGQAHQRTVWTLELLLVSNLLLKPLRLGTVVTEFMIYEISPHWLPPTCPVSRVNRNTVNCSFLELQPWRKEDHKDWKKNIFIFSCTVFIDDL